MVLFTFCKRLSMGKVRWSTKTSQVFCLLLSPQCEAVWDGEIVYVKGPKLSGMFFTNRSYYNYLFPLMY